MRMTSFEISNNLFLHLSNHQAAPSQPLPSTTPTPSGHDSHHPIQELNVSDVSSLLQNQHHPFHPNPFTPSPIPPKLSKAQLLVPKLDPRPALISHSSASSPSVSTPSSGSTPSSSTSYSIKTPKPPPISIPPSLRKSTTQFTQSLSGLLDPRPYSNSAGQQLELAERLDWDIRTGRSDHLAMRLRNPSTSNPPLPPSRDGGRDRWGNRWGIENHILSPVISERTEPTHTSVSSPVSTNSLSINSQINSGSTPDQLDSLQPSFQLENSQQGSHPDHHQHAMKMLNRKKTKIKISNRQRDLDIAHRQIAKRMEKQKREQMINRRDEIAAQLMRNPTDAKLVRDLGKLYLEFHHPFLESKPLDSFRQGKNTQTASRSEPSLKLAIHYLEQSIQLDSLDSLTWSYLAKAWSWLLAFPTENPHEREQRLSNSSLAFRKAIVISSNLGNSCHQYIQQTNRYRLSYAQHLESIHKYKEAASILQDALELDENDADGWWALGRMMELWALDTESHLSISKQERFERMKHSCEAYHKASELMPEDSIIFKCKSNGVQVLEKFKSELKEEQEAKARAHKAEEDARLTAERIRGLNLSPVTQNVPSTTSINPVQNTVKSSSTLELKKLVAELREIPEFGKKATFFSSNVAPGVHNEKKSSKEPAILIDSTVTQVESVVSSSPTPSRHVTHPTQASITELNESSSSHFSPSSHTTHENSNNARGLEPPSIPSAPSPTNPARYSSHVSPISTSPSTQNSSPISNQSHNDVRMTIMPLTTASMEFQTRKVNSPKEPLDLHLKNHSNHNLGSSSYAPPSPSALPTSMMQSLSSRLCPSKGLVISSPRNISTSIPSSDNSIRKAGASAIQKKCTQATTSESGSASRPSSLLESPLSQLADHGHDRSPKSLSSRVIPNDSIKLDRHPHTCQSSSQQLRPKDGHKKISNIGGEATRLDTTNRTNCESINSTTLQLPPAKLQFNHDPKSCSNQHQQTLADHSLNQDRELNAHDRHFDSPKLNSTCHHDLQNRMMFNKPGNQYQSCARKLMDSSGRGEYNSPSSPRARIGKNEADSPTRSMATKSILEDSWNVTGQNVSVSMRSASPSQIPPRAKSVCFHRTAPVNVNSIPSSPPPAFHANLQLESSLGIRLGPSPPSHEHHPPSLNLDSNKGYQVPTLKENVMTTNQPEQPRLMDPFFEARSPLSGRRAQRTTSLISPLISKPINEQFSTTLHANQPHHSSLSSPTRTLDMIQPQHTYPICDYSLIDSHLKSILEVDLKRKAELKEIKKQIRKTDEWAENQRRSIVEEIRRICTPVNNISTHASKLIQEDQNDGVENDGCSSLSRINQRLKYEDTRPVVKNNSIKTAPDHSHLRNPCAFRQHDSYRSHHPQQNSNMSNKFNKSEMNNITSNHETRRSMSTPPDWNRYYHHHPGQLWTTFPHHEPKFQPPGSPNQFPKETQDSNQDNLKECDNYRPLHQLPIASPDALKSHLVQYHEEPIMVNRHADQFDKLGPAGFAINGITSIIQLLHQPRRG